MAKQTIETRPAIDKVTSATELKRWYWLKDELIAQARIYKVKTTGAKFTILDRLAHFLDTGEKTSPGEKASTVKSKFDWHKEPLTPKTIITDSYKSSQNVRRFFRQHAGADFKFNIAFMAWMKSNAGKTLGDAIEAYQNMKNKAAEPGYRTDIMPHNQFNQYTRDFLDDNPNLGMAQVRRYWELKRALPTKNGRHVYEASDLKLS